MTGVRRLRDLVEVVWLERIANLRREADGS